MIKFWGSHFSPCNPLTSVIGAVETYNARESNNEMGVKKKASLIPGEFKIRAQAGEFCQNPHVGFGQEFRRRVDC